MESIEFDALRTGALVLVDSAPVIYWLEAHPRHARRYARLFERQAAGEILFAITTTAIAEILTGPLGAGEEPLARRYRGVFESWQVVPLSLDIAEGAARLRARFRLKLPDAIQAASALAVGADALVTHDRDFRRIRGLNVIV